MLYTGYFAKLNTYIKAGLIPVSICGKAPDWYTGLQYKVLASKWSFFNEWKSGSHKGDNTYYIEHFNDEVLNNLNPIQTYEHIKELAKSDKIILLCYEKPLDFCHRHIVADWFTEHGIICTEYRV